MLAIPCYDSKLSTYTATSLLSTAMLFTSMGVKFEINLLNNGTLIDAARNELADQFLKSDCTVMICLDADMAWTKDDILQLAAFSTAYPVVAGAYTTKTDIPKFIVKLLDDKPNKHGLLKIEHIGFGFVAIQKNVFKELENTTGSYTHHVTGQKLKAFFRTEIKDGQYVGEDIYFFQQLNKINIPAYLIPKINLGHIGVKNYNASFIEALQCYNGEFTTSLGEI